mmetsp:Transcript_2179/g.3419  ORF Transcript_2179/g.3419 Transcript_2179/m.3419 type:complete len:787 (+) Transcript_2179:73-2433(+)
MPPKVHSKKSPIERCEDLIRTFNPVTHSIDTHITEALGDVTKADAKPEDILIQQVVYGWYKDRPALKCFIDQFYGDNASRVLRVDMVMYTILTYIAVYRLQEMGLKSFKEFCSPIEPSKVSTFVAYLFDKENLWNTIRSAWMRVLDLEFVEKQMLPKLERFVPEMTKYALELDSDALSNAAAEAALEEAKAKGEAGLTKVAKKVATKPVSPRLTKTRPPVLPEPEKIVSQLEAKPVPDFINKTNLEKINKEREEKTQKIKNETAGQYKSNRGFKFHQTKGGRSLEEVKMEVEESERKQLAFDSSFYNPPPDFKKTREAAEFAINTSTILREDALYRKQQSKDAQILRNYEEELRDPFEYYMWQQDLRERDNIDKLKGVALRREQAKQSAVEAKDAMERQKEDNSAVANLMREQAAIIKQQKELEREIEMLKHQEVVQNIAAVRDTMPQEAMKKVREERVEIGKQVRVKLEEARVLKEAADRKEEEIKADRIRQQRAVNVVHKEHIVVFDPTLHAGIGLLDEMSYMEMKVRQKQERERAEEVERIKREEIFKDKARQKTLLEKRKESILRAREIKAVANQTTRAREKAVRQKEEEDLKRTRAIAAVAFEKELAAKREVQQAEQAALKAEQDRIKRQQQYLGAAMGQVEEARDAQLELARQRQARNLEAEAKRRADGIQAAAISDRQNKLVLQKQVRRSKAAEVTERDLLVEHEKRVSLEKIKSRVVERKAMFQVGQKQHEKTRTVRIDTNPYANAISEESLTKVRTMRENGLMTNKGTNGKHVQIIA